MISDKHDLGFKKKIKPCIPQEHEFIGYSSWWWLTLEMRLKKWFDGVIN